MLCDLDELGFKYNKLLMKPALKMSRNRMEALLKVNALHIAAYGTALFLYNFIYQNHPYTAVMLSIVLATTAVIILHGYIRTVSYYLDKT